MSGLTTEMADLLESMCLGELSPDEANRLETIVSEDDEQCQHYIRFMYMNALAERSEVADMEQEPQLSEPLFPNFVAAPDVLKVPSLQVVGAPVQGTFGYFSSGWPVAYLVATVVFGIGLLISAHVYVSQPVQVANQSASLPSPLSPLPSVVGRITGMVDCKWETKGLGIRDWGLEEGSESKVQGSDLPSPFGRGAGGEGVQSPIPNPQSLVSLGDQFTLRSGLMEITYDTGAKVILQGPVAYEVESKDSGFLSVGKLTARLEKKGEGGRRKAEGSESLPSPAGRGAGGEGSASDPSQSALTLTLSQGARGPDTNPQSPVPNPFAIRTPAAVVTDLGTEFGVEALGSAGTSVHVFRGVVEVQPAGDNGKQQGQAVRLTENESVRVEKLAATSGDRSFVVRRNAASPESFVRKLPLLNKALPVQVVTQFHLGEDDRDAVAGKPAASETVDHGRGRPYCLEKHGSPSYTGDTAAPASALAMSFNAANKDYFSNSQWYIAPTDNFVLEAWVRFNKLAHPNEVIAYMGDSAQNGYGIMAKNGNWAFLFGGPEDFGGVYADSGVKCEPGKWTHLALVCQRGQARLWIDGRPVGKVHQGTPNTPDHLFMIGGNLLQTEYFDGQIDEVRLSEFRGPFQPEMLMLPAAMRSPRGETNIGAETNDLSHSR